MLITTTPTTDLAALEAVITTHLEAFCAVGQALQAIRDLRLYRPAYKTFQAYCEARWDMGRNYSNKLISAASVVLNLGTTVTTPPMNEAQARPLTALDPDAQRIVWQVVEQTAPGGSVTAAHVKSVVTVFREVLVTGAIDNGQGESIRVHDLITAAITETTYERLQRQTAYILAKTTPQPARARLDRITTTITNLQALDVPTDQRATVATNARTLAAMLTKWADQLERAA